MLLSKPGTPSPLQGDQLDLPINVQMVDLLTNDSWRSCCGIPSADYTLFDLGALGDKPQNLWIYRTGLQKNST